MLATSLRDLGSLTAALAYFVRVRRPRVEKIIRAAAKVNNSKAPGASGGSHVTWSFR